MLLGATLEVPCTGQRALHARGRHLEDVVHFIIIFGFERGTHGTADRGAVVHRHGRPPGRALRPVHAQPQQRASPTSTPLERDQIESQIRPGALDKSGPRLDRILPWLCAASRILHNPPTTKKWGRYSFPTSSDII